jgi:hypothetical protein
VDECTVCDICGDDLEGDEIDRGLCISCDPSIDEKENDDGE